MVEKLKIKGQKPLKGEVKIGGAKNAVLKLMAASLLNKGECKIYNVPDLTDVNIMLNVLSQLGAKIKYNKEQQYVVIDSTNLNNVVANKKFRVGRLYANNVNLNEDSEIYSELLAKGKVKAKKLDCEMVAVLCEEIDCEDLIAKEITCGKLKAKILITQHNNFENISAENVNMYNEIVKGD